MERDMGMGIFTLELQYLQYYEYGCSGWPHKLVNRSLTTARVDPTELGSDNI
jgi:hypothetical protein